MAVRDPRGLTAELREAARQRVISTSLRKAAAEIGLSPTGLRSFIDGTDPHPATFRKLTQWHVELAKSHQDHAAQKSALAILVADVLPKHQRSVEIAVLSALREQMLQHDLPIPKWISAFLRKLRVEE